MSDTCKNETFLICFGNGNQNEDKRPETEKKTKTPDYVSVTLMKLANENKSALRKRKHLTDHSVVLANIASIIFLL